MPGLLFSTAAYVFSGPYRSWASKNPPTTSTAGFTPFRWGSGVRACQNAS